MVTHELQYWHILCLIGHSLAKFSCADPSGLIAEVDGQSEVYNAKHSLFNVTLNYIQ